MDLPTFHDLLTPAGQAALAAAAALGPTVAGFLASFETLRKRHPPALAKAAVETVLLRAKAADKHAHAAAWFYTREALEQSSGDLIAAYRAGRFAPFAAVLDLCSGIGADAVPLAVAGHRVEAIDADPLRVAMATANAAAAGVADRLHVHEGDVLTLPLPHADAAYFDPSRRIGERRFLDPEQYVPPLGAVMSRFPTGFPLAAKIAPGVARADLDRYDAEAEFVSVNGELKECVLWFGPLRTVGRRATLLPGPHTLAADDPPPDPPPAEVGEFVFDPDPAVIRAGLTGLLADHLGAVPVDHGVALLTGPAGVRSPFAGGYAVEHADTLHVGRLRDYLRERRVGRVTVLKRAVEVDVNDLTRKLKLDGPYHRWLIVTRVLGRHTAVVACDR